MRNSSLSLLFVLLFIVAWPVVSQAITAEELKVSLEKPGKKLTLIDVRNNKDYSQGHIPGAINLPARLIAIKQLPLLGQVVVYGDDQEADLTLEALTAMSNKPGISAEILEGGLGRWEALNFPITRDRGMEKEHIPYIVYHRLLGIARHNPDLVLVDLRKSRIRKETTSLNASSAEQKRDAAPDAEGRFDLISMFPGVRILDLSSEIVPDQERGAARLFSRAPELVRAKKDHRDFYVLIDNGDGSAEDLARSMRAAGVKRIAILPGGEKTLLRKGQPGNEKR